MISAVNVGFFNKLKLWPTDWASGTVYAVGDVMKPTSYASHAYLCTTAGTSAGSEATWSTTNGATTADNTAVWTAYDEKTYQVLAPQNATVPYVTFGWETGTLMGTFQSQEAIENLTYWVNCFSDKSVADVAQIADQVLTAIDSVTLTVSGFTNMKVVREFIGVTIYDQEVNIFQIPMRYRVWLDKD